MQPEFELCVETLQACDAAQEGSADRVELCAALGQGGVTPSLGFVREAVRAVRIPVHVLLRPRAGNFVYTDAEYRMICADLDDALSAGAAGVVVGVLSADGTVDVTRTAALVQRAQGRSVTFHRAFDKIADQHKALDMLIDLGCSRVLTSGGKPNVQEGKGALTALASQARGRIRIAAGGGVTVQNADVFARIPGLDLHASLRRSKPGTADDPLWDGEALPIAVEDVLHVSSLVHRVN